MTTSLPIARKFIVLGIIVPLAILLGYLLAGPVTRSTLSVYGLVLGVLLLPALLKWHHPLLIASLNAAVVVFFLPGQPQLWMLMALASLSISILNRIMNKEQHLISVPSLNWTLGFLLLVILVTAKFTGGISLRSMGGDTYGGKKFVIIALAVVSFYAISVRGIPLAKAQAYVSAYFLTSLTAVVCNIIYMLGPGLWWLFIVFQVDYALGQASEDFAVGASNLKFSRISGLSTATLAVVCFLLAKFGLRGVLSFAKPWRLTFLLLSLALSALSGFRSGVLFFGLLLGIQFCLEGLWRTRLLPLAILGTILTFAVLVPFSSKLPLSVQRTLSFLPLDIDSGARADAFASTEWRLQMWKIMAAQIPDYFWLGKGYATSSSDLYFAQQSALRGLAGNFETSLVAGDYHSGPLSVIIPFGIWGVLAFLAFLVAVGRAVYCNYRYGTPELKLINTLLLSYFLARTTSFLFIFGAFDTDLIVFCALAGLSVSLNGGVARSSASVQTAANSTPIPSTTPAASPAFDSRRQMPWRR